MMNPLAELAVAVSSLPDPQTVKKWEFAGYDRWISVCGVGLAEIGGDEELPGMPGHVYKLADPFSSSEAWPGGDLPNKQVFLASSTPALRNNLLRAVRQASNSLIRGEKLMVFCHLGRSRSPLVATAAVMLAFQCEPLDAWVQISTAHDVAPLSVLGLSALVWLADECQLIGGEKNAVL